MTVGQTLCKTEPVARLAIAVIGAYFYAIYGAASFSRKTSILYDESIRTIEAMALTEDEQVAVQECRNLFAQCLSGIPKEKWPSFHLLSDNPSNNSRNYSARYVYNSNRVEIPRSLLLDRNRLAYTMAHELGHYHSYSYCLFKAKISFLVDLVGVLAMPYLGPVGVLALSIVYLAGRVFANWHEEVRADLYATKILGRDRVYQVLLDYSENPLIKTINNTKRNLFIEHQRQIDQMVLEYKGNGSSYTHPSDAIRRYCVQKFGWALVPRTVS